MKHVRYISNASNLPATAMSTSNILFIIGTVFTGIGTILLSVSTVIGGK